MNLLIGVILFLAYTTAVFFGGFMQNEKRHARADAAAIVAAQHVEVVTKTITQERIRWRIKDATDNKTTAAAIEADIASHPSPASCPTFDTGLLNVLITHANDARRVYGGSASASAAATAGKH